MNDAEKDEVIDMLADHIAAAIPPGTAWAFFLALPTGGTEADIVALSNANEAQVNEIVAQWIKAQRQGAQA